MLEVHSPEHTPHSWRDFLIHIATIVIGLVIAVGIEQTVEYFHHRSEVRELRAQMREVFENNLKLEPTFMKRSGEFRTYLIELRTAVEARRTGHPLAVEPDRNDQRMRIFTSTPSLAPYDAAMQNGTIALLPSNEVRLYNRVNKQRDYLTATIARWVHDISEMEDFEKQFTDASGNLEVSGVVTTPDLSKLSDAELLEYRKLIAAAINSTDILRARILMIDGMARAILNGATEENDLMVAVAKLVDDKDLGKSLDLSKP